MVKTTCSVSVTLIRFARHHTAFLLLLPLALLTGGCKTFITEPFTSEQMPVAHVVVLWLNDSADEKAKNQIIQTTLAFQGAFPGLLSVDAGEAVHLGREGMDETYDLGLVMVFENKAALEAYLVAPRHQRAVRDVIRPNVARIQSYDFVLQGMAYDGVLLIKPASEHYSSPGPRYKSR